MHDLARGAASSGTRANSTHSTWPTTAHLTISHPATFQSMMGNVTTEPIPPFERFYLAHRDEVLGYLRRLLGQRAEDAWQETFLRALRAYDRLEHGRHLRAWVFTIATNVAMDDLRAKPRAGRSNGEPAVELRPRRVPRARAPDRRPAADRACRRRAALRLRPPLRPDRRRARLVRGGRARRGVVRRPPTEEDI